MAADFKSVGRNPHVALFSSILKPVFIVQTSLQSGVHIRPDWDRQNMVWAGYVKSAGCFLKNCQQWNKIPCFATNSSVA